MPWTADQTRLLREIGVSWVRASGSAPSPAPPAARHAAPIAAEPAPARSPPPPPAPSSTPAPVPVHVTARSLKPALVAPTGLDWDALEQTVSTCRACTLCDTRTQTVFGVGSRSAHWLIVGEAPGEQEDLKGEPFVGAAGRLLDQMLRPLGLSREGHAACAVYIANTLKCRPPGNRNPQAEELARCEPYLQRQVELLQPRIIVAMGRFALQQLLRSTEPVGRLRGRVHRYAGVPLVVTYHPAYLLRNPLDKSKAWADWCLAAQTYAEVAHG